MQDTASGSQSPALPEAGGPPGVPGEGQLGNELFSTQASCSIVQWRQ